MNEYWFEVFITGLTMVIVLLASVGKAEMVIDYDEESITCAPITYQFDLSDLNSAALLDVMTEAWNSETDDSIEHDEKLCKELSILMPLRD